MILLYSGLKYVKITRVDTIEAISPLRSAVGGVSYSTDSDISLVPPTGRKKRKHCRKSLSDVKRKRLTNLGKKYVTRKGKVVNEKVMGEPCKCRNNCVDKITHEQRLDCFKRFWSLGNKEKQWAFVITFTRKVKKRRCNSECQPNFRKFTYKYTLPIPSTSDASANNTVAVCKVMFLNTLAISEMIVRTAFQKFDGFDGFDSVVIDKRGRHNNHKIVIDKEMERSVCDHVNTFLPVESDSGREGSNKIYLDGNLSIRRMEYEKITLVDGKTLIKYQDYIFSFSGARDKNGKRLYLYCPKKSSINCRARLKLNRKDEIVFAYNEHNHPPYKLQKVRVTYKILPIDPKRSIVVLDNYSFAYTGVGKRYLKCSTKMRTGCQARFSLNKDGSVNLVEKTHNHPPRQYYKGTDGLTLTYAKSLNNAVLALCEGHSFTRSNKNSYSWLCSKRTVLNCRAKIKIKNDVITEHLLEHNHPPPKYMITKKGVLLKLD
ncbi:unnamed protein product [Colias eurytheme]|nr:unnamed protein product [Colias eurytheme]